MRRPLLLFLLACLGPAALVMGSPAARVAQPNQARLPIQLPNQPNAVIHGHAATVYMQLLAGGKLDADTAADLVVGALVTGQHSDEPMESSLILGRPSWPPRSGIEALGARKIAEPVHDDDDHFAYLGSGDLNADGRDDLVTLLVRRAGRPVTAVTVGVHFSPASWLARPDLRHPDVTLAVPSKAAPRTVDVADINCDRLPDLIVTREEHVGVFLGRKPWPADMSLDQPDIRLEPPVAVVRAADVNGDGCADLWLSLDGAEADAALVFGRPSWPSEFDAVRLGDVLIGDGQYFQDGAVLPDTTGDGLPDVLRIDHPAARVDVYRGGDELASRLAAQVADWSVVGISDTFRVEWLDLTGDGVVELLFDRHAVVVGRPGRQGVLDLRQLNYDAEWSALGDDPLWSLDIDGRAGADVLLTNASADVPGRPGAGTIRVFFSPLFVPPTASIPSPTVTASAVPSATASATGQPSTAVPATPATPVTPPPSASLPPSEGTPASVAPWRTWLPLAWAP